MNIPDMEQKVIKEDKEEIVDDFVWNKYIKQEMIEEIPTTTFQNLFSECVHKQEVIEDLKLIQAIEESTIAFKTKDESSHKINIHNSGNKFKYIKVKYGMKTKERVHNFGILCSNFEKQSLSGYPKDVKWK
ncbi:uncharacterized protein LOC130895445 isoform X2 [Diorhabda carinulata]|uniref:uncharacterized protein LOC130895445 isoform X2 n=1 Tax=Diorhabda carinulata TaxID=1163345 RepID=UPI0025A2A993|nr:uncharacterized protein LOC130895445 isoform X2 [Diorhabda carinulata]